MVITRRSPTTMPLTSRHTTQTPRKVDKGKSPQVDQEYGIPEIDSISAEGSGLTGPQFQDDVRFSDGSPPRKLIKSKTKGSASVTKTRAKTKRRKQPTTWLDFFSRLFILSFLIYTLSVCPQADKETSPVCRALSEYRRLVLEPYVITPFQSLLRHPSVAPYALPIIENSKPVIARTQLEWNKRVAPQWNKRVVPQWNMRVVPLWHSQVVPRWEANVTPQLDKINAQVEPYRKVLDETFQEYVKPHVERVHVVTRNAQPYVLLIATKTYDSYQASKPYISKGVAGLQKVPPFVNEYVVKPLAVARRQFVDPHVALLIEKVKELSSGTAKVSTGSSVEADFSTTPINTVHLASEEDVADQMTILLPSVNGPVIATSETTYREPGVSSSAFTGSASVILAESLHPPEASVEGATYSPIAEVEEPVVVVAESTEAQNVVRQQEVEQPTIIESEKKQVVVDVEPSSEYTISTPSLEAADEGVGIPKLSVGDDDVESESTMPIDDSNLPVQSMLSEASSDDGGFDQFFEDLDLDSDDEPVIIPSVLAEVSEEDLAAKEAARVEKLVGKRRDIEGRHAKWESDLEEQMEKQSSVLKDVIQTIRTDAVQRLKVDRNIRDAVDTLHDEAEKALKGTEAYLKKLREGGKVQMEQAGLWERVLNKVEKKFDERVGRVEDTVNTWYEAEISDKEREQFEKAYDLVKAIADDAQASLGMDYAWLDDVTAHDWKRYHKLDSDAKEWRAEMASLVDGTHKKAYPNPVLETFNVIQSEVGDITVGFQTRMRRIKREGERTFEIDQSSAREDSPDVSILPIVDRRGRDEGVLQDVAHAILQRGQDEVVHAMERLEQEPVTVNHEEL